MSRSAHPSIFAAIRANKPATSRPEWSWRSTGDPGHFIIWRHGESVGSVCLLPGHVERRAVLMDAVIEHLNTQSKENTQ